MLKLVEQVRSVLLARPAIAGVSVAFDDHATDDARLEQAHFHIHVLPWPTKPVAPSVPDRHQPALGMRLPGQAALVDGIEDRRLLLELVRCLIRDDFDRIDLVVSFIMRSGLQLIDDHLRDVLTRGGQIRVLTTD